MKISYNLLQTYFEKKLPDVEEVVALFEKHLAEVEEVKEVGNDTMIDVNILPDRACYALSHEGIALELSLLLSDNTLSAKKVDDINTGLSSLDAEVVAKDVCDRQIFVRIDNVDNTIETPKEIKEVLETLGQRSISFLVDLTNYVMFETGQPLHVFDASLVKGKISVRMANAGEKVVTLDNKEVALDESIVTIADEEVPLDIAGVKGGKKAETSKQTTSVILSASHFDSVSIRKTTGKVGIKTDASKRFENNISSTVVPYATKMFLTLLSKYNKEAKQVALFDADFTDIKERQVRTTLTFLKEKIGADFNLDFVKQTLSKMFLSVSPEGETLVISVPEFRKDLCIEEDVADELGRLFGYEKLMPVIPQFTSNDVHDPVFIASNKIRNFLVDKGFSEVYTYSLAEKGELEIINGLASDKSFLRSNLTDGVQDALKKNVYFADFLGQNKIQIFEIGKVFTKGSEFNSLCIGISYKKSKKEDEEKITFELASLIKNCVGFATCTPHALKTDLGFFAVVEINLDEAMQKMATENFLPLSYHAQNKYERVSEFPFIARDVAVFVAGGIGKENEVIELIKQNAGELLVKVYLFDVFEKKNKETGVVEKTSYGVRLVFQSFEKTLTDEEVNPIMDKIYSEMKGKGWEIR